MSPNLRLRRRGRDWEGRFRQWLTRSSRGSRNYAAGHKLSVSGSVSQSKIQRLASEKARETPRQVGAIGANRKRVPSL